MKDKINEQLFTEQVLELVASIQMSSRVEFEIANVIGGIGSILGSVTIACCSGGVAGAVFGGGILGKDPGEIPIDQVKDDEDDKEIKIALEIARNELFDYNREEKCIYIVAARPRKIKKIIIDALCPSLLKTSDDIFEIAKSSTPVLLTLSLSGTISLPIQPVFFAAAAILLARSSIAAICKDTHRSTPK